VASCVRFSVITLKYIMYVWIIFLYVYLISALLRECIVIVVLFTYHMIIVGATFVAGIGLGVGIDF